MLVAWNEVFSKILKKPSIVQKWMIPHMKAFSLFIDKIQQKQQKQNKMSFSSSANSQYFFAKISFIGPWVSMINWCEVHWRKPDDHIPHQRPSHQFILYIYPWTRDGRITLFFDIRIIGYLVYRFFLDTWISGYLDIMDTWILGYMDISFLWIHGYLDTLDINFFHYPYFGYPIQVSRYFWILF